MTELTPTQAPVPPLIFNSPSCGLCGEHTVATDKGWQCEDCGIFWPFDDPGMSGNWLDGAQPRCQSVDGRYLPNGVWAISSPDPTIRQCMLAAGHPVHPSWGPHKHTENGRQFRWTDADALRPPAIIETAPL